MQSGAVGASIIRLVLPRETIITTSEIADTLEQLEDPIDKPRASARDLDGGTEVGAAEAILGEFEELVVHDARAPV